ncbi:MAG TPA: Holliday junction resolvase [Pseudomonas sp.]|nr:Holliday junction resolvase [Pseudomonas sp.]
MRFLFVLLALLGSGTALAFDTTTATSVISGYATSQVTSAPFDRKWVRVARDDAAAYVASDGRISGARLESVMRRLRHENPELHAGDRELAQAILVQ